MQWYTIYPNNHNHTIMVIINHRTTSITPSTLVNVITWTWMENTTKQKYQLMNLPTQQRRVIISQNFEHLRCVPIMQHPIRVPNHTTTRYMYFPPTTHTKLFHFIVSLFSYTHTPLCHSTAFLQRWRNSGSILYMDSPLNTTLSLHHPKGRDGSNFSSKKSCTGICVWMGYYY